MRGAIQRIDDGHGRGAAALLAVIAAGAVLVAVATAASVTLPAVWEIALVLHPPSAAAVLAGVLIAVSGSPGSPE